MPRTLDFYWGTSTHVQPQEEVASSPLPNQHDEGERSDGVHAEDIQSLADHFVCCPNSPMLEHRRERLLELIAERQLRADDHMETDVPKPSKRKRSQKRKRGSGSCSKESKGNKPGPGDKSPWWKQELAGLYNQVPSSDPNAQATESSLKQESGKGAAKSWFLTQSVPLREKSSGPTAGSSSVTSSPTWRSFMEVDKKDVWSEENGAAYKEATSSSKKPLSKEPIKQQRCRKVCMRLSKTQDKTLRLWMGAYRFTYNNAIKLIRVDPSWRDARSQYLNEQLVYEVKNGHSSRVNANSSEEAKQESEQKSTNMDEKRKRLGVQVGKLVTANPWLLQVPSAIRKEACRDASKAYTSNKDNQDLAVANGERRRKFTLKLKNRRDDSAWTIAVPQQCLSQAWTEVPPDTRRPRKDGQPHKFNLTRKWTRISLSPTTGIGDVWLTEELPAAALKSWEGGYGSKKEIKYTIAKDCHIMLDKRGRFYMAVPYEIEPVPPTAKPVEERKVGAVDPGDRIQATVVSPADGEVVLYAVGKEKSSSSSKKDADGKRKGGKDRIFYNASKLDKKVSLEKTNKPNQTLSLGSRSELKSSINPLKKARDSVKLDSKLSPDERETKLKQLRLKIAALVASRWKSSSGRQLDTPSARRTRKRQMTVLRQKTKDLVTEAHHKIALDMTRRWDTLILPPFETQGMVKRKGRKDGVRRLHSSVARSLMSWRHYQFKIIVRLKFRRAGGEVLSPDERYTTMTCGACGILNEKHSNEQWTCSHCGTFHLRDPSASRCIFIKALGRTNADNGVASMDVDQESVAGSSPPDQDPFWEMTGSTQ